VVFGKRRCEEFDGDRARQPRVLSLVNNAHAAPAQRADDVEVRNLSSNHTRSSQICRCASLLLCTALSVNAITASRTPPEEA
jgi:hypothetical protein